MGSSQGRWWFGPEGSNREGEKRSKTGLFSASQGGGKYFLVVSVKGLRSKENKSEGFSLINCKKGISSSEVVRNCLGGQIRNVRHPWGCSFVRERGLAGDINRGTCLLTRSHLQPRYR